MISKRKMRNVKADSTIDSTSYERKPITAQDFKKMLQKRLYKLESESMPAT